MNTNHDKICITCSTPLVGKQEKYCSRKCHNKQISNSLQTYENQQKRAVKRKLELISLKGGKCELCGYSKNMTVLCFHHIDPSMKSRKLDSRSLSNGKWEDILREAEKCSLLCSNCHLELHHPETSFVLG